MICAKKGRLRTREKNSSINDVAGVKVILEEPEQRKLMELLDRLPDCEIVEEERHTGRYNATNLIVRYRPPREEILARPLGPGILNVMQRRGFSPDEARPGLCRIRPFRGRGCPAGDHPFQLPGDAGERDRPLHPRGPDHRTAALPAVPGAAGAEHPVPAGIPLHLSRFSSAGAGRTADQDSGTATCRIISTRS